MNRTVTNTIRYLMDEWIPPIIRDSRWFMYPFYWIAYRGKNISEVMQFKSNVYRYTPEQYANFYRNLDTISRHRDTDLNQACIDFILHNIDTTATTLIDVGCGGGYLLKQIADSRPDIKLTGFDIKQPSQDLPATCVTGNLEQLPFDDAAFDTVICCHTIEHLINLEQCIGELLRITRKQLFVVTPCQRFFYYTLDEHVNFFPFKEKLTSLFPFVDYYCEKLDGDWAYLARKDSEIAR